MNEPASRSRGSLRPVLLRRTLLSAAVIGSMMLAAGCHSGPGPQHTAVDGGGKTPYERALAIAQCMRHNGDPAFPDPGRMMSSTSTLPIPRYRTATIPFGTFVKTASRSRPPA